MRKILSASPLAVCALGALGLIGCSSGLVQSGLQPVSQPAAPAQPPAVSTNGAVEDWSTHQVVYPQVGPVNTLMALQHDPRALLAWQAAQRQEFARARNPVRYLDIVERDVHQDWSISLGGGGVANSMFPAKFSFDVTAAPSCANDFVVFPINVAGSGTQPNIVAFNNLYSGTNPTNGICNRAPNLPIDDGVSATTTWSYNVTAAGGLVPTSPALSLDGSKVVFVESGPGTTAHFHVLAWKTGDGVNASLLQSVASPVQLTSGFSGTQPAAGSGTVTDLALNTGTTQSDTLSSPFIDYTNDLAYVGNDSGILFRIKNVLCTTAACTGGGSPAPSLDGSWGTGGALTVGGTCSGKVSGPVIDGGTGNIFVGCSDGLIYGFTPAGAALATASVTVGNGSATGGIVDPPTIDAVRGFVYAVSGASAGGTSVMVQAKTADLTGAVTSTLGKGGSFNLHSPAFSNGYFTSVSSTHWLLYEWALNAAGTNITIYAATFAAGHVMNSGPAADSSNVGGSTPVEFSPLTEFQNGANDQVFVSGLGVVTPNFVEYNMNAFLALFPNSFPPSGATGATASESGGTSGMVVDDNSASNQASSIYFGTLTGHAAIKLTQSGLH